MAIDKEVETAIQLVVKEMRQSDLLARKIIAWLHESSERELTVEDKNQHLEAVRGEIVILDLE